MKIYASFLFTFTLFAVTAGLFAQGTAFTYQGQLMEAGAPANGLYDFKFALSNAPSGGSQVGATTNQTALGVTNGLFTTTLNFGDVFTGNPTWLGISVRSNGLGDYTALTPPQELTPIPYAIFANTASNALQAAQFSGIIPLAQLPAAVVTNNDSATVTLSGTFTGNGAGLAGVNAAALGGVSSAAFWKTNGNAGANPTNGAFLGTTDNNPLEIHVDGTRGLRIEPDSRGDDVPTLIGGYVGNAMFQPGSGGDFIGGGGFASIPNLIYSNSSGVFIGAGSGNQVGPNVNDAVLGGGHGNAIQAPDSVVGGGVSNLVGANAQFAFVGGGLFNSNTAYGGTVGGGAYNNSSGNTFGYSTVSGGQSNFTGSFATVGGGFGNLASGFGSFIGGGGFATDAPTIVGQTSYFGNMASGQASAIAGGILNVASGPGSFIGGGGFDASNNGDDFVVGNQAAGGGDVICGGADNSTEGLDSTVSGGYFNAANGDYSMVPGGNLNGALGFCSFAAGYGATANDDGSFVWSDSTETTTHDTGPNQFVIRATGGFFFYTTTGDKGAQLNSGDTSWTSLSDRNSKKDIELEDCQAVLNKLAQVPISRWHYNWEAETNTPHIGPMAQDFKHAFYPGRDDKGITTLEFDGVELAAIQGLNQKVEDQLKEKDAEIQDLKQSVADLKKIVQALAEKN
jgi:hypothetical protein